MAAYQLPSGFGLGAGGPLGWGLALICAILALPINVAVSLTFSLWTYFDLGHWVVAAVTACLYHGTVAVVLGGIYRRKPKDARVIGGAILVLHLFMYLLWQEVRFARFD